MSPSTLEKSGNIGKRLKRRGTDADPSWMTWKRTILSPRLKMGKPRRASRVDAC